MILASNNKGKIKELKDLLDCDIKSLKDINLNIEVEENEDTFYGNAAKKAREIYSIVKQPVIADDSGLCIDALNGYPGVLTHRALGENKSDEERNQDILNKLKHEKNRNAKVLCVLVYFDGKNEIACEGELKGKISLEARGNNGFGFDPIFELDNHKTLAEISNEEKNMLSARHLAAVKLKQKLKNLKVR